MLDAVRTTGECPWPARNTRHQGTRMSDSIETGKRQSHDGAGIAVGAGIGLALGTAFNELAMGLALGTALGAVFEIVVRKKSRE